MKKWIIILLITLTGLVLIYIVQHEPNTENPVAKTATSDRPEPQQLINDQKPAIIAPIQSTSVSPSSSTLSATVANTTTIEVALDDVDKLTTETAESITQLTLDVNPEFNTNKMLELCNKIGNKLGSVTIADCIQQQLQVSDHWTDEGNALAFKNYLPIGNKPILGKVLVIGGIHGDEYSSISIMFKWMEILDLHHSGIIHWKFIPVANPDGLLRRPAIRQNANGVDLNRNFPTADWNNLALKYWREQAYSSERRYPGQQAASETETQWLVKVIGDFNPDIVVSIHAPYELLDYDGPRNPPTRIGDLYLSQLGVFPGSLGNYGGVDLNKPIVTLELPSAGIMPPANDISSMWRDLVRWLIDKLQTQT